MLSRSVSSVIEFLENFKNQLKNVMQTIDTADDYRPVQKRRLLDYLKHELEVELHTIDAEIAKHPDI